jgi:hypothetical protein
MIVSLAGTPASADPEGAESNDAQTARTCLAAKDPAGGVSAPCPSVRLSRTTHDPHLCYRFASVHGDTGCPYVVPMIVSINLLRWRWYGSPPTGVPVGEVGGTALRPAQYAWRIGGEYQTHGPVSDREVVTNLREPSNQVFSFTIVNLLRPVQARVLLYNSVSENEVPDEGRGSVLDRVAGTGCQIAETPPGRLVVELNEQPVTPALVVLDVQYASLEPAVMSAGIASYGASWVVRLATR